MVPLRMYCTFHKFISDISLFFSPLSAHFSLSRSSPTSVSISVSQWYCKCVLLMQLIQIRFGNITAVCCRLGSAIFDQGLDDLAGKEYILKSGVVVHTMMFSIPLLCSLFLLSCSLFLLSCSPTNFTFSPQAYIPPSSPIYFTTSMADPAHKLSLLPSAPASMGCTATSSAPSLLLWSFVHYWGYNCADSMGLSA